MIYNPAEGFDTATWLEIHSLRELSWQRNDSIPLIRLDLTFPSNFPFKYKDNFSDSPKAHIEAKLKWAKEVLSKTVWFKLPKSPQVKISCDEKGTVTGTDFNVHLNHFEIYEGSDFYVIKITAAGWIALGAGLIFTDGQLISSEFDPLPYGYKVELQTGELPVDITQFGDYDEPNDLIFFD